MVLAFVAAVMISGGVYAQENDLFDNHEAMDKITASMRKSKAEFDKILKAAGWTAAHAGVDASWYTFSKQIGPKIVD